MTYTLDLTDEEMRRVRAAEARGVSVAALVKGLIGALPETNPGTPDPQTPSGEDPTLALFKQWADEDARMTTEEMEQEQHKFEEFKKNLNAERGRAGARLIFPENEPAG